ncbi:secretion protein [Stutzerimonas nosocomialis]|uniref:type II secretion system protein N n=1 Tax=Stutzerimonas nosocomialis TaxID=1056496 RepID=UPI001109CF20|nr:type II secretion system protein N [Stutzerimonas nosocomialis]TLX57124.1 secretion protein [Stutzerimonas nosocomialis]
MPAPGILKKYRHRLPVVAAAALIALFALYLAWQINEWIQLQRAPVTGQQGQAATVATAPDMRRMEALFGPPPAVATNSAPSQQLGLTLLGSFVHRDPQRSTAIIQREGSPPQLFQAGAEVASGIRLQQVYPDRVEVLRDGQLESLTFPRVRTSTYVPEPIPEPEYPDYGAEQPGVTQEPQEPDAAQLQQQMEALRQQMEETVNQADNSPPDEQTMENN